MAVVVAVVVAGPEAVVPLSGPVEAEVMIAVRTAEAEVEGGMRRPMSWGQAAADLVAAGGLFLGPLPWEGVEASQVGPRK